MGELLKTSVEEKLYKGVMLVAPVALAKTHLLRKLEHLGLGGTGVTEQQHINVATQAHAIVQNFGGA